jgi:hypothetical protein
LQARLDPAANPRQLQFGVLPLYLQRWKRWDFLRTVRRYTRNPERLGTD